MRVMFTFSALPVSRGEENIVFLLLIKKCPSASSLFEKVYKERTEDQCLGRDERRRRLIATMGRPAEKERKVVGDARRWMELMR